MAKTQWEKKAYLGKKTKYWLKLKVKPIGELEKVKAYRTKGN